MRRLLLLVLALCAGARAQEAEGYKQRVERSCAEISAQLEAWLGEKFPAPVPVDLKTKEEIGEFAREMAKRTVPKGMLETAQRLAVRLHQIPPGFDLLEKEIEMLQRNVAGLYDADTDRFYVVKGVGSPGAPIFTITVAHELVHAYRDVDKDFWRRVLALVDKDVDWMQGIRFLVEGDAQFLGLVVGQSVLTKMEPDKLVRQVSLQADQGDLLLNTALGDPSLAEFPLVLKEGLIAAYIDGMAFAVAVWRKGGLAALDRAYDRPPRSTEQALHPEKYLAEEPDEPTYFTGGDPTPALGEGWTLEVSNVMGEFDVRIHFTEALGRERARAAAAGWDGARFWFCTKEGHPGFVGLLSTWDTPADAQEFAAAWTEWAAGRDPEKHEILGSAGDRRVRTVEGLVVVRTDGADVLVADGVPEESVEAVLAAMAKAERAERAADAAPWR